MNTKQREELQSISAAITVNTLPNGVRTISCQISPEEIKHIVDTILAAPRRNCDVGTAKEQEVRLISEVESGKLKLKGTIAEIIFTWSQMPYESEVNND